MTYKFHDGCGVNEFGRDVGWFRRNRVESGGASSRTGLAGLEFSKRS